jgi:hypothetical protein
MKSQRYGLCVPHKHEFVFNFVAFDNPPTVFAGSATAQPAPQADEVRFGKALAPEHFARSGGFCGYFCSPRYAEERS